jgi:hypothetical protein
VSGELLALATFPMEKAPIDYKAGRATPGHGFLGKELLFALAGIEPRLLACQIRSFVTIPTALFFLLYYIMMLHFMHVNTIDIRT